MNRRRTSIYDLTFPISAEPTGGPFLEEMIALVDQEPDYERAGAGFTPMGEARILFRTTNDDMAVQLGRAIAAPVGSKLHTGLGVHRRLVKEF